MNSLMTRIKDAWLVLTGKGFISQEYTKPVVMHGRLSKARNVVLTADNPSVTLDPGEFPLRMTKYTDVEMGVYDTSMCHLANFNLIPDDVEKDRHLTFKLNNTFIHGAFDVNSRQLGLIFDRSEIASVVVIVEMPEYKLVEG